MLSDPEDDSDFKKFAFDRDRDEKITYISCKNPSQKNYETLMEYYVEDKFYQLRRKQQEIMNNANT